MQSLNARVWQRHFPELRRPVMAAFPRLQPHDVEAVNDDFDALVALIQRSSGLGAGDVHDRLSAIDVQRLGITEDDTGPGSDDQPSRTRWRGASIGQLRIGFGFEAAERTRILAILSKLDRQLSRFRADATDLELTVKDRGSMTQKVTLEVRLPKFPRVVATSTEMDLRDALMDLREDLWRRIDNLMSRRKDGLG